MSKIKIEIPYNPKENPLIEIYYYPEEKARENKLYLLMNSQAKTIEVEIEQALRYYGFDPSISLKRRYISADGKPYPSPAVYVNGVLFSPVDLMPARMNKLYEALKIMRRMRDEYFKKTYKNADKGVIVMADERFFHLGSPYMINWVVASDDFWRMREMSDVGIAFTVDSYEFVPASKWLIEAFDELAVPVTSVNVSRIKKEVLVIPDTKNIEL